MKTASTAVAKMKALHAKYAAAKADSEIKPIPLEKPAREKRAEAREAKKEARSLTYEEVIEKCFPQKLTFPSDELMYGCLALAGESGEVIEKVKKIARDKDGVISPADHTAILKELSDVLWAVTTCARALGSNLAEVIAVGKQKMEGRIARGTLQGSGDDR